MPVILKSINKMNTIFKQLITSIIIALVIPIQSKNIITYLDQNKDYPYLDENFKVQNSNTAHLDSLISKYKLKNIKTSIDTLLVYVCDKYEGNYHKTNMEIRHLIMGWNYYGGYLCLNAKEAELVGKKLKLKYPYDLYAYFKDTAAKSEIKNFYLNRLKRILSSEKKESSILECKDNKKLLRAGFFHSKKRTKLNSSNCEHGKNCRGNHIVEDINSFDKVNNEFLTLDFVNFKLEPMPLNQRDSIMSEVFKVLKQAQARLKRYNCFTLTDSTKFIGKLDFKKASKLKISKEVIKIQELIYNENNKVILAVSRENPWINTKYLRPEIAMYKKKYNILGREHIARLVNKILNLK